MSERSKLEQVLEFLVAEDNERAEELLHEYVVETARQEYERILDEDEVVAETKDEDESEEETVEETDESIEESKGYKIRDKSRGHGVADETYKSREEAKYAAVMKGASSGSEWEVIEESKPDFLDLDKDGDKEESMKKAAKDKKEKVEAELFNNIHSNIINNILSK